ncbi:hypothetical protein QBC40DRAFT_248802 [Triangularia verruculosa]|uniref:Uncharacterized protein n=1 Tax=Triangularia verruculosa TaxID=2587418 RepID=A0AAN6XSA3_9PEZI|nr:hypothetical protein QBC40DRAFT_248802 [Triangularia verruculosa]
MAEKGGKGKWTDESHEALIVALCNVLVQNGISIANGKDILVTTMARMGEPFTWEAIRSTVEMVRWNEQSNLDLVSCLYGMYSKEMGREVQAAIVAEMKSKGHDDINWDKIRSIKWCCQQSPLPMEIWQAAQRYIAQWYIFQLCFLLAFFFPINKTPPQLAFSCHCYTTITLAIPAFETTPKMPGPGKLTNRWEDMKDDLFEIIYQMKHPLSAEEKDTLVREMRAKGYNIGWNGLRYVIYHSQESARDHK